MERRRRQFGGEAGSEWLCGCAIRRAALRQDGTPAAADLGHPGEHGRDACGRIWVPAVSNWVSGFFRRALRRSGSRRLVLGLEWRRWGDPAAVTGGREVAVSRFLDLK